MHVVMKLIKEQTIELGAEVAALTYIHCEIGTAHPNGLHLVPGKKHVEPSASRRWSGY